MAERLRTASIAQLGELARQMPSDMSAKAFVDLVFERDRHPKTSRHVAVIDGAIKPWQARMLASEWDREGITPPSEFVEALSCEAKGHPRAEARSEMLSERFADGPLDLSSEYVIDEYAQWRYGS